MRRLTAAVFSTAAVLLSGAADPAADPPPPTGYRLVWSDEFNYAGKPDPAKWTYERGVVRNHEPQVYTDSLDNARVEDGHLVVEAREEPGHPGHFTSASLITQGKASWTYGRIEVRAKLPNGAGAWPAIWMLGDSHGREAWPFCGETDIMELWGGRDGHLVKSTLHYVHGGKHQQNGGSIRVDDPTDYHVYATEWTPEAFTFFVDDRPVKTIDIAKLGVDNRAFHVPQYLLLNVALDAKQGPIQKGWLPMQMLVDWVRVYQKR